MAAIEAEKKLKKDYGATIFGFGDFNKLNLTNGLTEEAQRKYWQLWVEESTKRFVAAVMRHYEQREEYSV